MIKLIQNKKRRINKKNKTPLTYIEYDSEKMFKVLENNKEDLLKSSNQYNCEDDIYGLLLKTGKYINAKDIIYLNIGILFLIKIIQNK